MSLNSRQKLTAEKSLRPNVPNEIGHFALGDSFVLTIVRKRFVSAVYKATELCTGGLSLSTAFTLYVPALIHPDSP
jgi:hypothetical protein